MKKYILILVILIVGGYFYNVHRIAENKRIAEEKRLAAIEYQRKVDEEKTYLLGHFDPASSKDFIKVPVNDLTYNRVTYLRKETYNAFIAMQAAALKDGVTLKLASATRNFLYQKDLWEKKWNGTTLVEGKKLPKSVPDGLERFKTILEYSAAPSTSRHHWGTDIDLNGANPEYFEDKEGKKVYAWMVANAQTFGFCQPYTAGRAVGYNEEKWHWSYLPVARQLTQDFKTIIKPTDITGFLGDTYAPQIDLINDYVLGINPACL